MNMGRKVLYIVFVMVTVFCRSTATTIDTTLSTEPVTTTAGNADTSTAALTTSASETTQGNPITTTSGAPNTGSVPTTTTSSPSVNSTATYAKWTIRCEISRCKYSLRVPTNIDQLNIILWNVTNENQTFQIAEANYTHVASNANNSMVQVQSWIDRLQELKTNLSYIVGNATANLDKAKADLQRDINIDISNTIGIIYNITSTNQCYANQNCTLPNTPAPPTVAATTASAGTGGTTIGISASTSASAIAP